ncbi:WcaI family glycosyltransferase [Chitinophagaceae bacterium LB-8]|uniref:WcaI family glycosyltransferase n=1 Tax=Paraflavisolibacter caeni TaxID=2982496 RepID=A0A9X3B649_9BACT|nr:WcaI family glycosyltransferase [Paraflavisolibacter caeni]MCU7547505.1 WcaI family glycosyltransferase [Paraflavisolibacter caeni]
MKKRLLLIGGNFTPEQTGIGKYNGEMINWFSNRGYDCTVITTSPYYPQWKVQQPYSNKWYKKEVIKGNSSDITVYRCPQYVPGQPSGLKRLIQEVSFNLSSLLSVLRILAKKKFDYVVTVVPPFYLGLHAVLYRKLRGAKFLYHVQDLQIDAAKELNMIQSEGLINTLFNVEKYILKNADVVSAVSTGMIRKMKEKTMKDVVFSPNWVDLKNFYPLTGKGKLKHQFGFAEDDKIILYSGAIGEKQGLEMILTSASKLKAHKNLKFVICGTGPYKDILEATAIQERLDNICFFPLQHLDGFNAFLNMADVHLVIQKKGASDLVMPSKLNNILAVGGLVLVTANPGSSLYQVVDENNIGILVEPENEVEFTKALIRICSMEHSEIKQNARKYVEDHLSMDEVLSRFIKHFN